MKSFFIILLILTASVGVASAEVSQQYQVLEPLPGMGDANCRVVSGVKTCTVATGDFSGYLNTVFNIGIIVAIMLSVIMLVIGGVEYMGSDSVFNKESAKSKFQNAIWGLVLALGIYLFLFTINPDLIKLKLTIAPTTAAPSATGAPAVSPGTAPGAPAEAAARKRLNDAGISINKNPCANIGDQNCTNVGGLSENAINGLIRLARVCGCAKNMIVTGGTEYWLHGNRSTDISRNGTAHKPGGSAVDLSILDPLNQYIYRNGGIPTKTSGGDSYVVPGFGTFLDEKIDGNYPHWHVTF